MTNIRLLYALLMIGSCCSLLTGCVTVQNHYGEPRSQQNHPVRYVASSGCNCSAVSDAPNVSTTTYYTQDQCCGRCSGNTRSYAYYPYYYPYPASPQSSTSCEGCTRTTEIVRTPTYVGNRNDSPPTRTDNRPRIIYLPEATGTPPILPQSQSYPQSTYPVGSSEQEVPLGSTTNGGNNTRVEGINGWEDQNDQNDTYENGDPRMLEQDVTGGITGDYVSYPPVEAREEKERQGDKVAESSPFVPAIKEEGKTSAETNSSDARRNRVSTSTSRAETSPSSRPTREAATTSTTVRSSTSTKEIFSIQRPVEKKEKQRQGDKVAESSPFVPAIKEEGKTSAETNSSDARRNRVSTSTSRAETSPSSRPTREAATTSTTVRSSTSTKEIFSIQRPVEKEEQKQQKASKQQPVVRETSKAKPQTSTQSTTGTLSTSKAPSVLTSTESKTGVVRDGELPTDPNGTTNSSTTVLTPNTTVSPQ